MWYARYTPRYARSRNATKPCNVAGLGRSGDAPAAGRGSAAEERFKILRPLQFGSTIESGARLQCHSDCSDQGASSKATCIHHRPRQNSTASTCRWAVDAIENELRAAMFLRSCIRAIHFLCMSEPSPPPSFGSTLNSFRAAILCPNPQLRVENMQLLVGTIKPSMGVRVPRTGRKGGVTMIGRGWPPAPGASGWRRGQSLPRRHALDLGCFRPGGGEAGERRLRGG